MTSSYLMHSTVTPCDRAADTSKCLFHADRNRYLLGNNTVRWYWVMFQWHNTTRCWDLQSHRHTKFVTQGPMFTIFGSQLMKTYQVISRQRVAQQADCSTRTYNVWVAGDEWLKQLDGCIWENCVLTYDTMAALCHVICTSRHSQHRSTLHLAWFSTCKIFFIILTGSGLNTYWVNIRVSVYKTLMGRQLVCYYKRRLFWEAAINSSQALFSAHIECYCLIQPVP